MIAAFGESLDEQLLRRSLRAEDAEDASDALRRIVATQVAITDDLLQLELERLRRIDPRGMTRPAGNPEEREWLGERGEATFVETPEGAAAARAYYDRKYGGKRPT